MASRSFNRKQALEKEVKEVYALITFGNTGAPTLTSGYGVASVSRTSQGLFQITLQDKYCSLKFVEGILLAASAEDIRIQLKAEAVSTAKTLDIFTLTSATATDPASGSKLLLKFDLKNTTVA